MKALMFFLLVIIVLIGVGCEAEKQETVEPEEEIIKEEITEPEEEIVEEEIAEEEVAEEEVAEDSIDFFKFIGWTEEEIINYFDEEEPIKFKEVKIDHIFFEKQNIYFFFTEGKVSSILIHEGNTVLGVVIDDKYNEENIIEKLGKPDAKGVDRGAHYMSYFVEDCIVVFYEDFQGIPFSAAIFKPE